MGSRWRVALRWGARPDAIRVRSAPTPAERRVAERATRHDDNGLDYPKAPWCSTLKVRNMVVKAQLLAATATVSNNTRSDHP